MRQLSGHDCCYDDTWEYHSVGMEVSITAGPAGRARGIPAVLAAIVVILGLLSMHAVRPIAECALPDAMPIASTMTDHERTVSERAHSSDHGTSRGTDTAHGSNQCSARTVRKTLVHVPSSASTAAVGSVAAVVFVSVGRRRDRLLRFDRLSTAGGLRR